ncbi:MAG TPA: NAD+ synthase [Planctomycetota bacterium]|nr:NAD+ synthase [Planctomycetota bacterium]
MRLPLDAPLATRLLSLFLREEAGKFGFRRAVLGLSGGVDSAVTAALAALAFGGRRVLAVLLPYRQSSPESLLLARDLVGRLRLRSVEIDITPMADGYLRGVRGADRVRRGNVLARCRMTVLYDLSAAWRGLVLGTSDKSELLLGYTTLHGDSASALNPIGDLYKTQVLALGAHLGVPEAILRRPPSPDLWPGQSAERELGFSYERVDALLHALVDRRYAEAECVAAGFPRGLVRSVAGRIRANQFKRMPSLVPKLSNRTLHWDFRYPRDWGR